jgi:NAD(P)H-dependent FMN reductase
MMVNIGIIAGSTRPGRFGIQPATWLYELARQRDDANFELVDLEEVGLPLLDESVPPAMHQYEHAHTKRWAERVAGLDGFVFVTAEYNHSIPGALKNAIDFLFQEWHYKPASFVSYGSAAGGARAVEHLRGVMAEIKVYDLREQLLLSSYYTRLDENGQYQFTDEEREQASAILDEVVLWAEQMQPIRERLTAPAHATSAAD